MSDPSPNEALARRFFVLQLQVSAAEGHAWDNALVACLCREIGQALQTGDDKAAATKIAELERIVEKLNTPAAESNTTILDGDLVKSLLNRGR
ncbi:MAG: hypothetical protein JNK76_10310 [Planctomycetales bacterium]|nr:hypothetical protein [Planctomycetales bacterium]MBN8623905.1 hypothetical protein [Planctomycetota bacterium]